MKALTIGALFASAIMLSWVVAATEPVYANSGTDETNSCKNDKCILFVEYKYEKPYCELVDGSLCAAMNYYTQSKDSNIKDPRVITPGTQIIIPPLPPKSKG